jgi:hypothetical protein
MSGLSNNEKATPKGGWLLQSVDASGMTGASLLWRVRDGGRLLRDRRNRGANKLLSARAVLRHQFGQKASSSVPRGDPYKERSANPSRLFPRVA